MPEGRQLFPELSVLDNLHLGRYALRAEKRGRTERLEFVLSLFPTLRLDCTLAATVSAADSSK